MESLQTYAAIAEIFGALTIILGGAFGIMQLREFYDVAKDPRVG